MPKKAFKHTNFSPRTYEDIRLRLLKHRDRSIKQFQSHHPHAASWLENRKLDLGKLRLHSQKIMGLSGLTATLLLSAPQPPQALPQKSSQVLLAQLGIQPLSVSLAKLQQTLAPLIPHRVGHLDPAVEIEVTSAIKETLGITTTSNLEGQRLNHSLGWIGYEQHLLRYPGDDINQHEVELASGIAPHTGAWGYFASSKSELNDMLKAYEQYYVAVQTLYLPAWGRDTNFLSSWYKHRKVAVINTENGHVVVAVIGDAGPAAWTGKQFGGSPEVMRALDLTGKKSKGKVLMLFVDDPQNQVPLGPVTAPIGKEIQLT